ncbi:MAG TPA: serine hydrolase domain-containing protein [Prosthecobacter sp.]|nr:serine hydrolase domain-containing protein [Prosthecobacter sp.]
MVIFLAIGSAHVAAARTWTEAGSGKQIEAEFVSSDGVSATIGVAGGRRFTLPLARLSPEDQAFVRQQQQQPQPGDMKSKAPGRRDAKAEDRFEEVPRLTAGKIPVKGKADGALRAVDEAIQRVMAEKGIPALTFALSKDGKILHDRAFGWADADLKKELEPGVKMRVASMTKPIVSAAIRTLFQDKKLKPEDLVFDLLELGECKEATSCDPRFKAVTIEHLLEHKGGWDRDKSGDLTTRSTAITELFRVKPQELEPNHIVRYGLTQPMDFDPGERSVYCNFGYILLVRVIEKVSGQKFVDYLHNTIGKVSGAESFSASSSDARDRQAGEIWYCYHPEYAQKEVPLSFRTEARDGAGVLACTAADYCRFLEAYWISGEVRDKSQRGYSFNGSHPGVTAVCAQRADGISYAAIANRRESGKANWNSDLRKAIDAALEEAAKGL